mgnify:FL=1
MKEDNDIFKKFRDSFSKIDGHFHILEQRVPVERQMEYFKYSEKIRKDQDKPDISKMDFSVFEDSLDDPESTVEHKKYVLSMLATSRQVKAYRILEEYAQAPDPDVADWAYMALMESRIALESELSDEKQIYISTGLGGKGEKLRFYVLMTSKGKKPFQEYQRQTIEREFAYYLPKTDCEIERLTIGEQYVELVFLIPVRTDIKATLDRVINECNQYGDFLSNVFTITNVKELTAEEVSEIINKNGDD